MGLTQILQGGGAMIISFQVDLINISRHIAARQQTLLDGMHKCIAGKKRALSCLPSEMLVMRCRPVSSLSANHICLL